jgi:hypothetical protein
MPHNPDEYIALVHNMLPRPAAAAAALLLLLSLRATVVSSAQCSVELREECEWDSTGYYATTILFIAVADADVSEYDADISFHWGGAADTKVFGTYAADAGEEEVSRTHVWEEGGDHYAGYTVSFDGGIGCDTRVHSDYFVVHYDDECSFEDFVGSNVPTMSAVDVLTSTPTEAGTDVSVFYLFFGWEPWSKFFCMTTCSSIVQLITNNTFMFGITRFNPNPHPPKVNRSLRLQFNGFAGI